MDARVPHLVAPPDEQADWERNEDEQVLPEVQEIARNVPHAPPAQVGVRLRRMCSSSAQRIRPG